jgi:hypothetical protein
MIEYTEPESAARSSITDGEWSMSQRAARTPKSRPTPDQPSAREELIVSTALGTPEHMPEPFVAARMFFRFDPGFRAELMAARSFALGSTVPLPVHDLSGEGRFDLQNRLAGQSALSEVAYGLAVRWALEPGSVASALAFDDPPDFPSVVVRPWNTDPVSGLRHADIEVHSIYVWKEIVRALKPVKWLRPIGNYNAFVADAPETRPKRIRGMDADVAARTFALHFLQQERPGERPTGGTRTWVRAVELWMNLARTIESPEGLDDRRPWKKRRDILLRQVFSRLPGPALLLMAIQDARCLDDEEWATVLGIDIATWNAVRSERAVLPEVWAAIARALPEVADDLHSRGALLAAPASRGRDS